MTTDELTKLRKAIYKRIGILQKLTDKHNIEDLNASQLECLVRISELKGVLTRIGVLLRKRLRR